MACSRRHARRATSSLACTVRRSRRLPTKKSLSGWRSRDSTRAEPRPKNSRPSFAATRSCGRESSARPTSRRSESMKATTQLRRMLRSRTFLELPAVYDPLAARIAESVGFRSLYNGGFVTGGMSAISEPLLTMTEQIGIAAEITRAVKVPLVMDAGAGWGEPLHTMRTVRECIRAGIAGVHIEDQLFPKRAHYHTYIAHNIPRPEYRDKIALACRQRDETDKDFVIIARSDACREQGFSEAIAR